MRSIDFNMRLTSDELIAVSRALEIAGANDCPVNINRLAKRFAEFWDARTDCKQCGHSVVSFDFDEDRWVLTFNKRYKL